MRAALLVALLAGCGNGDVTAIDAMPMAVDAAVTPVDANPDASFITWECVDDCYGDPPLVFRDRLTVENGMAEFGCQDRPCDVYAGPWEGGEVTGITWEGAGTVMLFMADAGNGRYQGTLQWNGYPGVPGVTKTVGFR